MLASFFGNTGRVAVLVGAEKVAAIAGASSVAIDDDLRRESVLGELTIVLDVESVGEGRGGSVSPAGTAVDGDVLVSGETEVVGAINVSPVPVVWKSFETEVFVRSRTSDALS